MNKPISHIEGLRFKVFSEILTHASKLEDVRAEVYANHDNNRWWPLDVEDWRLRILLAGWSTRISYSMVNSYAGVVRKCNELGFDALGTLSTHSFHDLIKPLGLIQSRWAYYRSACSLIDQIGNKSAFDRLDNNEFIEHFQANVEGAGYKVAQCAVLYAKGYHCGVMPVDSGMVEMLAPCFGEPLPSGAIAHEKIRTTLEDFVWANGTACRRLISEGGYGRLTIPDDLAPTWWAHLVLIYYKRLHWNKNKSDILFRKPNKSTLLATGNPRRRVSDRSRNVILSGDDSAGIDRVIEFLKRAGYTSGRGSPAPWVIKLQNFGPSEISLLQSNDDDPIRIWVAASASSLRKRSAKTFGDPVPDDNLVYGFVGPHVSSSLIATLVL